MKRIRNSKRGFTLIELMLALAIITIIGWTTVALMIAIRDSFMTTYNVNDASDYAMLYANGFENAFLAHTQKHDDGIFRIRESDSVLCSQNSSVPVFSPSQMKTTNRNTGAVVDKWLVRMYFKVSQTDYAQVVQYKIIVLDNYYAPDLKEMCVYEGSVWAPHMGPDKLTLANNGNYASDGDKAHYYNLDKGLIDNTWFDTITYKFS